MYQSQAHRLRPPVQIIDRLETYWRSSAAQTVSPDIGVIWFEYGDSSASFNIQGVCGAVHGNVIERYGIPILAVGDSGEDVERLLGKPNRAAPNHYSRRGNKKTDWRYYYEGSNLTVYFADGTVSGFTLRANAFSDSGC